jgi:hypothetical protein
MRTVSWREHQTALSSKKRQGVGLEQYRKVNEKWQFVAVAQGQGPAGNRRNRAEPEEKKFLSK